MTPRDVLLKAAVHLERCGWRQDATYGAGGDCCTFLAMQEVSGIREHGEYADEEPLYGSYVAAVDKLVVFLNLRNRLAIARWNDAPGRTAKEVIAALRGAAGGP